MITLTCTKCGNTLHVDDGFAGGVCRCSKCGTIQTVPGRGQSQAGQAIFERAARGGAGSTSKDLEALGEIVTSSGLVGSGIARDGYRGNRPRETQRKSSRLAAILGGGVAALVGLWLAFGIGRHGPPNAPPASPLSTVSQNDPPAHVDGPSFGPIALDAPGGAVVYLVDRGDATRAYTDALGRAVIRSATSLGAGRKFQVRYWTADGESPAFPLVPAEATAATLAKLGPWMSDIAGGRSTDATASLDAAVAVNPAEIVVLTGKAWQLDDSFANEAMAKLATAKVRIDGVALGGSAGSDALARLTAKTGGRFVEMDAPTLAAIAK